MRKYLNVTVKCFSLGSGVDSVVTNNKHILSGSEMRLNASVSFDLTSKQG